MTECLTPVDRIVAKFGTQQKLADAIGIAQSTVAMWKKRGNIPSRNIGLIIDAAAKRRVRINTDEFFDLPARTRKRGAA